ncbi:MAG: carboxymuconolactone decarboxylase family protein [Anaerolineales bacterium]
MTLIQTVSPESATGEVAAIYAQVKARFSFIPAVVQMRSASPTLLRLMLEGQAHYMDHPTLSAPLLACIRMLVSQRNQCAYCIDLNASLLINLFGWSQDQVAATRTDIGAAHLSDKDKAMLRFVVDAVADPLAVQAPDLDRLRALGWSDADILDGLNHGAVMSASDILINAFKVERDF